jgi:hypothetical protein
MAQTSATTAARKGLQRVFEIMRAFRKRESLARQRRVA